MPKKIHLIPKSEAKNLRGQYINTMYEAANHLECSLSTLKVLTRTLGGSHFYAINTTTGSRCFFKKSPHNYKLEALPATYYDETLPHFKAKKHAAKYLSVTSSAIDAKLPTPGKWLVRNVQTNKTCYVTYTPRKR